MSPNGKNTYSALTRETAYMYRMKSRHENAWKAFFRVSLILCFLHVFISIRAKRKFGEIYDDARFTNNQIIRLDNRRFLWQKKISGTKSRIQPQIANLSDGKYYPLPRCLTTCEKLRLWRNENWIHRKQIVFGMPNSSIGIKFMIKNIFFASFFLLLILSFPADADTIILKNGKKIETMIF